SVFLLFDHLKLFRISPCEFRVCLCSYRRNPPPRKPPNPPPNPPQPPPPPLSPPTTPPKLPGPHPPPTPPNPPPPSKLPPLLAPLSRPLKPPPQLREPQEEEAERSSPHCRACCWVLRDCVCLVSCTLFQLPLSYFCHPLPVSLYTLPSWSA